jgi:hypothetical protein
MISLSLALLLAAAPDATSQNREAYARCLKDFMRASLEQKMEPAAFDTAIVSACKDKEAPLKAALLNADLAMGLKRAASEKSTSEQIADYLSMAKEDYRADLASAPKP